MIVPPPRPQKGYVASIDFDVISTLELTDTDQMEIDILNNKVVLKRTFK